MKFRNIINESVLDLYDKEIQKLITMSIDKLLNKIKEEIKDRHPIEQDTILKYFRNYVNEKITEESLKLIKNIKKKR